MTFAMWTDKGSGCDPGKVTAWLIDNCQIKVTKTRMDPTGSQMRTGGVEDVGWVHWRDNRSSRRQERRWGKVRWQLGFHGTDKSLFEGFTT